MLTAVMVLKTIGPPASQNSRRTQDLTVACWVKSELVSTPTYNEMEVLLLLVTRDGFLINVGDVLTSAAAEANG